MQSQACSLLDIPKTEEARVQRQVEKYRALPGERRLEEGGLVLLDED
jgi:hypothetical protein